MNVYVCMYAWLHIVLTCMCVCMPDYTLYWRVHYLAYSYIHLYIDFTILFRTERTIQLTAIHSIMIHDMYVTVKVFYVVI